MLTELATLHTPQADVCKVNHRNSNHQNSTNHQNKSSKLLLDFLKILQNMRIHCTLLSTIITTLSSNRRDCFPSCASLELLSRGQRKHFFFSSSSLTDSYPGSMTTALIFFFLLDCLVNGDVPDFTASFNLETVEFFFPNRPYF